MNLMTKQRPQNRSLSSLAIIMASLIMMFAIVVVVTATNNNNMDNVESGTMTSMDEDYLAPSTTDKSNTFFLDHFNEDPFSHHRWIASKDPKYNGEWEWAGEPGTVTGFTLDKGLLLTEPAKHYAIAHKFSKPLVRKSGSDLVVQYEVKFEKEMECGGAYLKMLKDSEHFDVSRVNNDSPYVIMFGPDFCGATNKVHFIFRHQNPISGEWEEKHMKDAPRIKNDQLSHVYTLIVRNDESFEVLIDLVSVKNGSLLADFEPPVNPPKEIDDPEDVKPADWVDEAYIDDPEAVKPDDWDEEAPEEIVDEKDTKPEGWYDDEAEIIADPEATKPEDWDDEEDGDWVAPSIKNPKCEQVGCGKWEPRMIKNPSYKGKWYAPKINNPAYKGEWKPRQIPNPNYFEDNTPSKFAAIGAIALELWTMQGNILFDNFLIAFDEEVAKSYAQATWAGKYEKQKANLPKVDKNASQTGFEWLDGLWEQAQALYEEYPLILIGVSLFSVLLTIPAFFLCLRSAGNNKPTILKQQIVEDDEDEKDENEAASSDESEKEEEKTSSSPSNSSAPVLQKRAKKASRKAE